MRLLRRSLATKVLILIVVFFTVPVIVYSQFKAADDERRSILLTLVQEQGRMVARSLGPTLQSADIRSAGKLNTALARIAVDPLRIKLLFRPEHKSGPDSFFYIASAPLVPTDYLAQERDQLARMGILDRLAGSCAGNVPLASLYTNPKGQEELLTSVTPVNTAAGCWAVITARPADDLLGTSLSRPYWQSTEIRIAGAIYLGMAVLVLFLFVSVRRNLQRFARHARRIRASDDPAPSFASINQVPELDGVATAFDRMVDTLRASALAIRRAAEDNAHALKTPIAVIRQALEPLRRSLPGDEPRCRRGVELIENSVNRLDSLVSAARRMDESIAELIDPPEHRVDLSSLIEGIVAGFNDVFEGRDVRLVARIDRGVAIHASEDLLETVVENLLENALSFSPAGTDVSVRLARHRTFAELSVEDQGPGVDAENLERIFERYFSDRPQQSDSGPPHSGIGLWIVRRNVEAIGGTVHAGNLPGRGLRLRVYLPVVD